jgi:probable LLM family oxidoreductase
MQLGIYTFADIAHDARSGRQIDPAVRMKNLIEEIELADQLGIDVFGIGEHHRIDYLVSSPAVVLAAAAVRTKRIRLTSAVTVLSSDDPVRVFQDFATVDLLSNGRAEIMAGRGSFIESFPLFGYDLKDYDDLFTEKLDLLLNLRESTRISWQGTHRPSIQDLSVYPRPLQDPIPIWVAVGGTPASVVRAAKLGLPLALAIIGGAPSRFLPMAQLYRKSAEQFGQNSHKLAFSVNSLGFVADNSQEAADTFFPEYAESFSRIGRERGWGPTTRAQFEASIGPDGALLVGSPQQVIDKILYEKELFGLDRFGLQMTVGEIDHAKMMRSIELYGTIVAPAVR